jgi:hypothetical protein
MQIVVNRCHGGFGLSHTAIMLYAEKKGIKLYSVVEVNSYDFSNRPHKYKLWDGTGEPFFIAYITAPLNEDGTFPTDSYFSISSEIKRTDTILIEIVRELGDAANTKYSKLEIIDIPEDISYEISDYDGYETVEETHRSW